METIPETDEHPSRLHAETRGRGSVFLDTICTPCSKTRDCCKTYNKVFKKIFLGVLFAAYLAYFITACWLNFKRALTLVIFNCAAVVVVACTLIKNWWGPKIVLLLSPVTKHLQTAWPRLKWILCLSILTGLITWMIIEASQGQEKLLSLCGYCVYILLLFAFSKHHRHVYWRAVFWGLALQFLFGVLIIRTEPGFQAFQLIGAQVQIFLDFTRAGSSFVFGEKLIKESFAFLALPIVVFFSSVISVLYYLGIIQWVVYKISWLLQVTMNTTIAESLSVAGNIFLGMTESLMLIHPYLAELTSSEIHAVMTGGFSTISGSVLGAFVSFGIDASSLVAASVMAAPCALAMAKLVYPEVEESKFQKIENVNISCGEAQNLLEAASTGAAMSVEVIASIAANLIAFLAILAFVNSALAWLGQLVNVTELSFQMICSYVFMPGAFLLGTSWDDAALVAELLGTKIFLNEFVAYQRLSSMRKMRLDGKPEWGKTGKQWISVRSEIITTFALCGFANLGSTGIMLGVLTSLIPERKSEISRTILRSLFTGVFVSLINSCIAGILYVSRGEITDCPKFLSTTNLNTTNYNIYRCCKNLFASTVAESGGSFSFTGDWSKVNSQQYLKQCCKHYVDKVCGNV
uniref:Sodium/nucleoside cotransporter n=1 Tax=Anolis carolinensis TaxID=28377 RepID=H9GBE3_ANOCA|nr:PREDICTED: sodium/nucleoside cotransporter 2 isoform X1 [Anolis carolinensis]|eukprot:XP_008118902.1 PREDICTED: sodium/nucleoside cotransporter 2 isoform X1 [Anolis carolinensis]